MVEDGNNNGNDGDLIISSWNPHDRIPDRFLMERGSDDQMPGLPAVIMRTRRTRS